MAGEVALDILLRWCILTHEPWKDDRQNRLEGSCVQEAHLVDRKTSRKSCELFEKIWCIPQGKFRLNSPLNTIPLRADWHRGLDCRGWIMLPRVTTLTAINESLKKGPESAAAIAPWMKENGKTLYQRHRYMFIPLDERSRTIPIATRKISKNPDGEGLVTQWGTKDDIVFHDGAGGLLIHSLAHPFPVIWKAVKMFGEHSNPMVLAASHTDHATAMFVAQMIYHEWLRLAGSEEALTKQMGEDKADEDDADTAASDGDPTGSTQERDEFDPSRNDEEGLDEDDEANRGDPYNTAPHMLPFDIPENTPSLMSDSHSGEAADPDSKPVTLWVGPLPRPRKPAPHLFDDEDSESEDSDEAEDGKRPSNLMPAVSQTALLDKWFKNDYKVESDTVFVTDMDIGAKDSPLSAKTLTRTYDEEQPVGAKRKRTSADDM